MQGGGSVNGPTVVARVGSEASLGQGRPIVPQTISVLKRLRATRGLRESWSDVILRGSLTLQATDKGALK
jgi:hypothetical protein